MTAPKSTPATQESAVQDSTTQQTSIQKAPDANRHPALAAFPPADTVKAPVTASTIEPEADPNEFLPEAQIPESPVTEPTVDLATEPAPATTTTSEQYPVVSTSELHPANTDSTVIPAKKSRWSWFFSRT